ncbi:MlaE family ABC transporter permease [Pseudofrancisella aestuarii]|uniref:MlaE family ABC transporter permease n=1 Tax=Pseudofrancisella aestuarii TaxID=2670347 RepID=A0ABV9T8I7_9GAMM|nr:ABC transporter permease [Pseudofrancisella aestuarii]
MDIVIKESTAYFSGEWTVESSDYSKLKNSLKKKIKYIDIKDVSRVDTTGACLILKALNSFSLNIKNIVNGDEKINNVISLTSKYYIPTSELTDNEKNNVAPIFNQIYMLGKNTNNFFSEFKKIVSFLGAIFIGYINFLKRPQKAFFSIVLDVTYDATIKALSIIVLLSLIIGLVLTYLPMNLMMQYGTQIFVVDMLGISSFREFAPLFTAIIVAGRSGSAFTSEIGIMKVNEEIDALQTIGEDPMQRLILPRITALMISLPVLTVIAMIANIIGGIAITYACAGITPLEFIERLFSNVSAGNFWIGLVKTPFFALVIAGIGCLRGITVKRDSQSVGAATTASVVYSIFLIIVVDAIFAVALNGIA